MGTRHGLVLLSCVRHQRMYAPLFNADPDVDVVAVADADDIPDWMHDVNREYAKQYDVPYITDIDKALGQSSVSFVSICSEPTRHARLACQAAQAGKHIWIDKPLATTVSDADAVVSAVNKSGVELSYVHRLYSPAIQQARSAIDRGDIGLPYALDVSFVSAGGLESGSVEDFQLVVDRSLSGGGELMNFLGYPIDTARYLTGLEVTKVHATAGTYFFSPHRENEVEDFGVVNLTLERGVMASITVGRSPTPNHPSGGDYTIRVHGSNGTWVGNENRPALSILAPTLAPLSRSNISMSDAMIAPLVSEFIACLNGTSKPMRTAHDGRAVIAVIEAAYRSIQSGRVEKVTSEGPGVGEG